MSIEKRKSFRSDRYLAAFKGLTCVMCGADDGTIVPAHYSGKYSLELGKGGGQKSHDFCAASLCMHCHAAMDSYIGGNDDQRAIKFMLAIFETQRRMFESGVLCIGSK